VTSDAAGASRIEAPELRRVDEEVAAELTDAVAAAEKDPVPEAAELLRDVYVEG
jgi:TPP-dependent pyruvate/acetoin dehydrogenase alpha subunit